MGGPGRGPMGGGMVGQKAMNFGPSAKRLLAPDGARARPRARRRRLAVVSVFLIVLGPRMLGHATDLIFAGSSAAVPAGTPDVRAARAPCRRMDVVPGQGVDFDASARPAVVLAVYVGARCSPGGQGYLLNDVVQGTVRRMRSDVEDKINALPLELLRQAAARRADEPGHQRHRQRQPDPAADDEPAAHLAADRGRGARR